MMVESEIKELTEDEVLGGVMFAHRSMQPVIEAIIELAEHTAKEPFDFVAEDDEALVAKVTALVGADINAAYAIQAKGARHDAVHAAKAKVMAALAKSEQNPDGPEAAKLGAVFKQCEANVVRRAILDTGKRIDGRAVDVVRPIVSEVSILPRAHGSALFTRGATNSSSTPWKALTRRPSCCTTTSHPTRWARPGA